MPYVIINSGNLAGFGRARSTVGLGALGAAPVSITPAEFAEQVSAARRALFALSVMAGAIENGQIADVGTQEAARIAKDFATRVGPNRLDQVSADPTNPHHRRTEARRCRVGDRSLFEDAALSALRSLPHRGRLERSERGSERHRRHDVEPPAGWRGKSDSVVGRSHDYCGVAGVYCEHFQKVASKATRKLA